MPNEILFSSISFDDIKKYNCFFFDFDGVVLESTHIKTDAFVELYSGTGFEEQVRKYHLANQGISRFVKFEWIAKNILYKEWQPEHAEILGNKFSELVLDKILKAPFVAGVEHLLHWLQAQKKFVVVASGTPQVELNEIIVKRNLQSVFKEYLGTPKSKTDIINEVVGNYKFQKNECLFLGDASTDCEAAKTSGIDFLARYTSELHEYWLQNEATFIIPDFSCFNEYH